LRPKGTLLVCRHNPPPFFFRFRCLHFLYQRILSPPGLRDSCDVEASKRATQGNGSTKRFFPYFLTVCPFFFLPLPPFPFLPIVMNILRAAAVVRSDLSAPFPFACIRRSCMISLLLPSGPLDEPALRACEAGPSSMTLPAFTVSRSRRFYFFCGSEIREKAHLRGLGKDATRTRLAASHMYPPLDFL